MMTTIERIQTDIKYLSPEEYSLFRQWFFERDWELWDKQIEKDIALGKLDFLLHEALVESSQGTLKEL
ncbi:hypothetical protein QUF64_01725 [Anaerolineales bacterium HSG6]|nr:hypothetical protein [Anaerolineales bacterium HSG6]